MKKNLGTIDKVIRLLLAALVIILFLTKVIYGVWGIVLLVFAGIFILTALMGFCPIYYALGLNSGKKD